MNILRLSILSLFLLLLSYNVSSAQTLLITVADSCVSQSPATLSSLYTVNPQNGDTALIGPIGFSGVTGMAVLGDGRLVGSAQADDNGERISILIEINPNTGQGTLIGTIGSDQQGGCGRAPGLTYDPVSDTLYGIGFRCDGSSSPEFLTINQITGEGTRIGETGFFGGGNALARSESGVLFSAPSGSQFRGLITINPLTGMGIEVAEHPLIEFVIAGMDFQPGTGTLYGVENGFGDPEPWFLVTINTTNAALNRIAQLPDCSDALVFINLTTGVPTLSEWGLIAMAGVLGIVGFIVARRKVIV